jgi:Plasmid pRiA4b ORF-3-like protein
VSGEYLIGATLCEALPHNLFEAPDGIEVGLRRGKILTGRVDRDMTGDLPLQPGVTMTYLYDFGDHWVFDVQLERIDPVDLRLQKPRILETHNRTPKQYSDWPDR